MSYLDKMESGVSLSKLRIVVYGPEGVGKSSLAATAPSPIFLDTDDGTSRLDVRRYGRGFKWEDVLGFVRELATSDLDCETLVIDELGHIEGLVWDVVKNSDKYKRTVGEIPYGAGYDVALDQFRLLIYELDRLREKRNMNVFFLAHSDVRTFKNPEGGDFDRYELKLHKKVGGLLKQQSDAVLFMRYEEFSEEHDKDKRNKGLVTGERFMYTERRGAFDAKNRFNLPQRIDVPIDFSWNHVADLMKQGTMAMSAPALIDEIQGLIVDMDEQSQTQATNLCDEYRDNPAKLQKLLAKIRARKTS